MLHFFLSETYAVERGWQKSEFLVKKIKMYNYLLTGFQEQLGTKPKEIVTPIYTRTVIKYGHKADNVT